MTASLLALLRLAPSGQPVDVTQTPEAEEESTTPLMRILLAIIGIALLALLFLQRESLFASLTFLYGKIGFAIFGLVPLTILVVFLLIYAMTAPNPRQPWVEGQLLLVESLGQLISVFGTLDGLMRAMSKFTLDQGAEGLLHALPALIGGINIMAASNLWGVCLVILAVLLQSFLFGLEKKESIADSDKANPDAASQTSSEKDAATAKRAIRPAEQVGSSSWQERGK